MKTVYAENSLYVTFTDLRATGDGDSALPRQLVIEKSLAALPRRRTDGAYIIRCRENETGKAVVFKLNASTSAAPVLVKRSGAYERQYRFSCPRCNLLVGYQSTPLPVKSGPYLYILKGALTHAQGQIPKDAFEGLEESNTTA
ncbi:hypothetical protein EDD17DRAFT_1570930 [Pisolithus thermaeus]|nr:hypothetical protein EDD17DRAFT_1570930 [Pisolithus thermaeus]